MVSGWPATGVVTGAPVFLVAELMVAPAHRGQGLGRRLLDSFTAGHPQVRVTTRARTAVAHDAAGAIGTVRWPRTRPGRSVCGVARAARVAPPDRRPGLARSEELNGESAGKRGNPLIPGTAARPAATMQTAPDPGARQRPTRGTTVSLPDLTTYAPHRTMPDAAFEGTAVPGLRADFYRRADGDRIASVGHYRYRGRDVLMAWGYTDEEHCRRHAVHHPEHGWQEVVDGCPRVRPVHADGADGAVVGLEVRAPGGQWLRLGPQ